MLIFANELIWFLLGYVKIEVNCLWINFYQDYIYVFSRHKPYKFIKKNYGLWWGYF